MNDSSEVARDLLASDQNSAESESPLPADGPLAVRLTTAAGMLAPHSVSTEKRPPKKAKHAILRCECFHAKSIHSRMYANRSLGTPCNFPECRCKAYRPAKEKSRKRSR